MMQIFFFFFSRVEREGEKKKRLIEISEILRRLKKKSRAYSMVQ